MAFDVNKLTSINEHLSNMVSIFSSPVQIEEALESVIIELIDLFEAKYCYIKFKVTIGDKPLTITKAIGVPVEQATNILNYVKKNNLPKRVIEDTYVYKITKDSSSSTSSINLLDIKSILHIVIDSSSSETITLYSTKDFEIDKNLRNILFSVAYLLKETYQTRQNYKHHNDLTELQLFGYNRHIYPTFLVNSDYEVIDSNNEGIRLLGNPRHIAPLNILTHIPDKDVTQELLTWSHNNSSKNLLIIDNVELNLPAYSSYPDISIITNIITKKENFHNNEEIILLNCILKTAEDIKPTYQSTLQDVPDDLYSQLERLTVIYREDPQFAAEQAMKELFPFAIALVFNQQAGPMILTTSPKYDRNLILQNAVKLMTGLNDSPIKDQGYITGIMPWSDPKGEMRWVAFYIDNTNARGKVELHLIGLVTKSNLLMVIPEIAQILYGTLLGAMNGHIEVIKEDNVDFCTKAFNYDQNFSSLSLLQDNLKMLRQTSSEILGAYAVRKLDK